MANPHKTVVFFSIKLMDWLEGGNIMSANRIGNS